MSQPQLDIVEKTVASTANPWLAREDIVNNIYIDICVWRPVFFKVVYLLVVKGGMNSFLKNESIPFYFIPSNTFDVQVFMANKLNKLRAYAELLSQSMSNRGDETSFFAIHCKTNLHHKLQKYYTS